MAERQKHLFQFGASDIAQAAHDEAVYHLGRENHWRAMLNEARETVKQTARIKFVETPQTGGTSLSVVVDFGDEAAYRQMNLAWQKMLHHHAAYERYESDERLYATQFRRTRLHETDAEPQVVEQRIYELDADDVAHFRLNGRPREE